MNPFFSHCSSVWRICLLMAFAGLLLPFASAQVQAQTQTQTKEKATLNVYLPIEASELGQLPENLSALLQTELDRPIKVHTGELWFRHQKRLREGTHTIVFAAPHFAAWTVQNNQFNPFLKLNKPLQYLLLAKQQDTEIFEVSDLANKEVCLQQPLNLDYLFLKAQFTKMLTRPLIDFTSRPFTALTNEDSLCRAFMVVNDLFERFPQSEKQTWTKLLLSKQYPNYAWLAHPKLKSLIVERIKITLLSNEGQEALKPLNNNFCASCFLEPAEKRDYPKQYSELLDAHWGS